MSKFFNGLEKYIYWTSIPKMGINDIVDILIVSVMIYLIVKWIKTTRAWVLLKGIIILLCIAFAAYILQLHTVSWILSNTMSVGITAILIVFQPELRNALEQLGRKNWVTDIFSTESRQEEQEYTARTLQEISRAAIEMGKVKTGALIVLERTVALGEYERTGIPIDAKVSSQLLINIFEHNTPLHDGAVVIKNGCHFLDLQRVVLEQNAKVSAVPVGVQNKRIQNAHPPEGITASDAFKIAQKSGNRPVFCQDRGLGKAVTFAGEKGALGNQLPVVETEVIDCRSRAKQDCQLRSQILRHRFHAEYAAGLIQLNGVLLPHPAFGVLPVCTELRGGGREARAGHRTVKSSLRDHLVERVLIKRNVPPLQVGICCPDPEGIVQ